MTYDHYNNAGNKGDVWKHVILLSAVGNIIKSKRSSGPFLYWETHAGRHSYTLRETGNWQSGIGSSTPIHEILMNHPYFCIQGYGLTAGSLYRGSWSLVAEYLRSQEISFDFVLCDLSPQVLDENAEYILQRPEKETIDFRLADGFSEIRKISKCPDIVFIDPPYHPEPEHDWISCREAVRYLQSRNLPFLIWYPIFDDAEPQSLVNLAGSTGYEIIWDSSEDFVAGTMRGAGMLIVNVDIIDERMSADLADLAQQLGGRFYLKNG